MILQLKEGHLVIKYSTQISLNLWLLSSLQRGTDWGKKKKKISLCLVEIYEEEHAESMAATDRQLIWPLCFA